MNEERKEVLMRVVIFIVSGVILGVWMHLIKLLIIVHWIYAIFSGKRNEDIAEFCHIWNTQAFRFVKYVTFVTNTRPWPFTKLGDTLGKFEK